MECITSAFLSKPAASPIGFGKSKPIKCCERILFENYKKNIGRGNLEIQKLISPVLIQLSEDKIEVFIKNSSLEIKSLLSKDSFISNYIDCELLKRELSRDVLNIPKEEIWRLVFTEIWLKEFFEKDVNSGKFIKHSRFG